MDRKPVVAGQFYPATPKGIRDLIASFKIKTPQTRQKTLACILPHAGFVYSGKVAAATLSSIEPADTYIIIGPNHTGYGTPCSISKEGTWSTPLGEVPIDTEVAQELLERSEYLAEDHLAHAYEHSIEVELPLIQELFKDAFSLVPIILATGGNLVYKDIAGAVAETIKHAKKRIMIIASSDMTHYEPQKEANRKDEEAIKAMLDLDHQALLERVERLGISMCGYIPAVIAIMAARMLGAKTAHLIDYQTSGDVTGDYSSVVGYAGLIIP